MEFWALLEVYLNPRSHVAKLFTICFLCGLQLPLTSSSERDLWFSHSNVLGFWNSTQIHAYPIQDAKQLVSLSPGPLASSDLIYSDYNDGISYIKKYSIQSGASSLLIKDANLKLVEGIASFKDEELNLLFVSDTKSKVIRCYDMSQSPETRKAQIIAKFEPNQKPKILQFDVCSRNLFALISEGKASKIVQIAIESSNYEQILIADNLKETQSFNLDLHDRILNWIEIADNHQSLLWKQANLRDASQVKEVCTLDVNLHIYDVAFTDEVAFISDWKNMALWKVEMDTCKATTIQSFQDSRPMGITFIEPRKDPPCQAQDGSPEESARPLIVTAKEEPPKMAQESLDIASPCFNYCLNGFRCSLTSVGIPFCQCGAAFKGPRCEIHSCQNFCLNGGQCYLNETSHPKCLCAERFSGERCQLMADLPRTSSSTSFVMVVAYILFGMILATACVVIFMKCFLSYKGHKSKRNELTPGIIGSNDKGQKSMEEKKKKNIFRNSALASVEQTPCQHDTRDGVIIDVEDCCNMILCDKPCVIATFRKPLKRKNHKNPSSPLKKKLSEGEDQDYLLSKKNEI